MDRHGGSRRIAHARDELLEDEGARRRARQAAMTNLTFVKGDREPKDLDPVSQAILDVGSGTSIFDPVLCEIAYRWFCPAGGVVLDPFAGGSVRGIVASKLGRRYVGVELRAEQVAANAAQMHLAGDPAPEWRQGDSREIATIAGDVEADLVFSCPPYWNLEEYSDDPADLSAMGREEFFTAYAAIIRESVARLRNDRFAVWVIGDVRDDAGCFVNLPGRTVEAFEAAGARFYNDAILVTAVGSLPIRAGKQFKATRKLGRTHQNVLVFVKGDPRKATEACGEVEFGEIAPEDDQEF
jgi:DNA modification methylase